MLERAKEFVLGHKSDIILVVGVVLISLLSFAAGYILAKQQMKEPIKIEKSTKNEFNPEHTNSYISTDSRFAVL